MIMMLCFETLNQNSNKLLFILINERVATNSKAEKKIRCLTRRL